MATEATTPRLFVGFAKRVQQAYNAVMCRWLRWRIQRQCDKNFRRLDEVAISRAKVRRIGEETDRLIRQRQSA